MALDRPGWAPPQVQQVLGSEIQTQASNCQAWAWKVGVTWPTFPISFLGPVSEPGLGLFSPELTWLIPAVLRGSGSQRLRLSVCAMVQA